MPRAITKDDFFGEVVNSSAKLWLKKLKSAEKQFSLHGEFSQIKLDSDSNKKNWVSQTRQLDKRGVFPEKIIDRLEGISFPFEKVAREKQPKPTTSRAIELYQRHVDFQEQKPEASFSDLEQEELRGLIKHFEKRYEDGGLSETAAFKMGICHQIHPTVSQMKRENLEF